jgi:hypothetical protein
MVDLIFHLSIVMMHGPAAANTGRGIGFPLYWRVCPFWAGI